VEKKREPCYGGPGVFRDQESRSVAVLERVIQKVGNRISVAGDIREVGAEDGLDLLDAAPVGRKSRVINSSDSDHYINDVISFTTYISIGLDVFQHNKIGMFF